MIYIHYNSVGLALLSLDSIPFEILYYGNATMVYMCTCIFFMIIRITIGHFWLRCYKLKNLSAM
jgi:hypothetical protein